MDKCFIDQIAHKRVDPVPAKGVTVTLSHRDLVLIRVALFGTLNKLKDHTEPACQKSYADAKELCNRLFQPSLDAAKLEGKR